MSGNGRVLVTGGTGTLGVATTRWLTRAGHDVVVFSRHEPHSLPGRAQFMKGDISDFESVTKAMADCDTVVHLAWMLSGSVTHEEAEPINLGGTCNVLAAMSETGCSRLVFASSVTAYGAHPDHPNPWKEHEKLDPAYGLVYEWHKVRAEELIEKSGVESVRVRPTVVVGRDAHNAPANVYRQLVIPDLGGAARIQTVHQDDVGRFFAQACDSDALGAVNLAAPEQLTWSEIAKLAGRLPVHTPARSLMFAVRGAARLVPAAHSAPDLFDIWMNWPIADTTRLTEDFGFRLAYSSADAIADQGRNSASHIVLGMREFRKPTRLDRATLYRPAQGDNAGRSVAVLDAAQAGEFDTVEADPHYPEWTCANLAEAFPGPMTPLSLHLCRDALFLSADLVARLLPLNERIRENIRRRQLGIFGHRFYQNVSVLHEMAGSVPGMTPEDYDHQINGHPYPDGFQRPRLRPADLVAYAKFAVSAGPRLAGLDRAVYERESRAADLARGGDPLPTLSDEALGARIEILWDETLKAWQVGNLCTFLVSAPAALLERRYGSSAVATAHRDSESLSSSRLLTGVKDLAGLAAEHPAALRILEKGVAPGSWPEMQDADPDYAARVSVLINACGHRGPGETELANRVYADSPELLLAAIAGAVHAPPLPKKQHVPTDRVGGLLARVAWSAIARRERSRDATTKITHQLRLALREWGRRLTATGRLAEVDDVFYLTPEELFAAGGDNKPTIARRRAERDRLRAAVYPLRFTQPLAGTDEPSEESQGTAVSGIAAGPGVVKGRVRILRMPGDDLDAGEVLVASATDTGWTPFFGMAVAVVTDIGGMMSHAAIVAREFGIPAVVGTVNATSALRNGQLVQVDGTSGIVTVLE